MFSCGEIVSKSFAFNLGREAVSVSAKNTPDVSVFIAGALNATRSKHTVHNFEVAEHHTYIADGMRVHNTSVLDLIPPEQWPNIQWDTLEDESGDGTWDYVVLDNGLGGLDASGSTVYKMVSEADGSVTGNIYTTHADALGRLVQTQTITDGHGQILSEHTIVLTGAEFGERVGTIVTPLITAAILGEDASVFEHYLADTIIGTFVENAFEMFGGYIHDQIASHGLQDDSLDEVASITFADFGDELIENGVDNALGLVNQWIMAEIFEGLNTETFGGKFAYLLANQGVNYILDLTVHEIATDVLGLSPENIDAWGLSQPQLNSLFDGSNLLNLVFKAAIGTVLPALESTEAQIGSALITAALDVFASISGVLGTVLGYVGGVILDFIFDEDPEAITHVEYNDLFGGLVKTGTDVDDGGNRALANGMATAYVDFINGFLESAQSQSNNLEDIATSLNLAFGHYEEHFRNGDGHNYGSAASAISAAILETLKTLDIADGDAKYAAVLASLSEDVGSGTASEILNEVSMRLQIASDYQNYLENKGQYDALIAADPDSAFAAGWVVTFNLAAEYGFMDDYVVEGDDTSSTHVTSSGNDTIHAYGGNDTILAMAGDDIVYAGAGNDTIYGYEGDDKISGEAGHDTIYGGSGNDTIWAGSGNDVIYAGPGNNYVQGGDGKDLITFFGYFADYEVVDLGDNHIRVTAIATGEVNELYNVEFLRFTDTVRTYDPFYDNFIMGTDGDDLLTGTELNDAINGLEGDDIIYGYDGDDFLSGDAGDDQLFGGAGNDWLFGVQGNDIIVGDDGDDNMYGGTEGDYLWGGTDNDMIRGEGGDDVLYGNSGVDTLYGGDGDDIMEGGDGDDILHGGEGDDDLFGGAGQDVIYGNNGDDEISGGDLGDDLYGGWGDDIIHGDSGWDWLEGQGGDDTLYGGGGNDWIIGGWGDDIAYGGDGDDKIFALWSSSPASAFSYSHKDTDGQNDGAHLYNEWGADIAFGGAGNDQISLNGARSIAYGGEGDDIIYIGAMQQRVDGGTGNDIVHAQISKMLDVQWFGTANGEKKGGYVWHNDSHGNHLGSNDFTLIVNVETFITKRSEVLHFGQSYRSGGRGSYHDSVKNVGFTLLSDEEFEQMFGEGSLTTIPYDSSPIVFGDQDDVISFEESSTAEGSEPSRAGQTVYAGGGDDTVDGGSGNDALYGEAGNDTLYGWTGADYLNGGDGGDILDGGSGNDELYGEIGGDTLEGGSGDDLIYGGWGEDTILGGSGHDTLYGDQHNDTIEGGAGRDTIYGGGGNDTLSGDDAPDTIYGENGNDIIHGGDGSDMLDGGDGNDEITGGFGYDDIHGGNGNDILYGDEAADSIWGDSGTDVIAGGQGNDNLYGGDDDDTLYGGNGNDDMHGGNGDDILFGSDDMHGRNEDDILFSNEGADKIDGGSGNDTVSYSDAAFGVQVDLSQGRGTGGEALDDLYLSIENFEGSNFDDIFVGSNASDDISGLSGNDVIDGAAGDDVLSGGNGDDILRGGAGDDTVGGGAGNDRLYGDDGSDLLRGYTGNDELFGGAGDDEIHGQDDDDTLHGGIGNDELHGDDGDDTLFGDDGIDVLYGGEGSDILYGGTGGDLIEGGSGSDVLLGDEGEDSLYGQDGNDMLSGGLGNDILTGGAGKDAFIIAYGDGHDEIEDFVIGTDKIALVGGSYSIVVRDTSGGALVLINANTSLLLKDIQASNLSSSDFAVDAGESLQFVQGILGTDEAETLHGTAGSDVIIADSGNDRLYSNGGQDVLYGGNGIDRFYGSSGNSSFYGGSGRDYFYASTGSEMFDGGSDGRDAIYYTSSDTNVVVNLTNGWGEAGYAEGDTYKNIERVYGSNFDDVLTGDENGNHLYGQYGDDNLYGMNGNDLLDGGAGNDAIYGGAGNDTLMGKSGADVLHGGDGNDTASYHKHNTSIYIDLARGISTGGDAEGDVFYSIENLRGGYANDTLIGDTRANTLRGDRGDDVVVGGKGDDTLYGNDGADTFIFYADDGYDTIVDFSEGEDQIWLFLETMSYTLSTEGADVLLDYSGAQLRIQNASESGVQAAIDLSNRYDGTSENDVIDGSTAPELLSGHDGNDTISSNGGNDILFGGGGSDKIYGDTGDSLIFAGSGRDYIYLGIGAETVDGGSDGRDALNFSSSEEGVTVDLLAGTGHGGTAEGDTYINVEWLYGSNHDDTLTGDSGGNRLYGQYGNDILFGGAGQDRLEGQSGDDTLYGGDDNDILLGGAGADTIYGGAGTDRLSYHKAGADISVNLRTGYAAGGDAEGDVFSEIEDLQGGYGNDSLTGNNSVNTIWGNRGDDTIRGYRANDTLYGNSGSDTFVFYNRDGNDVIKDFEDGLDKIQLSGKSWDLLTVVQDGDDTIISHDGEGTIRLEGIDAALITADDFVW